MVSSRLDIYQFTKDCGNKDNALKKVYSEHNAIFPQKQFQKMFFSESYIFEWEVCMALLAAC